jgi:hypothetical protein
MENYFLTSIGCWNLIGSIVLYLMLNNTIADRVLGHWTEIITHPYDAGKYGSFWLLWAATTNTFLSIVNIFAVHWEQVSKVIVVCGDLFVYSIFLLSMIVAISSEIYKVFI